MKAWFASDGVESRVSRIDSTSAVLISPRCLFARLGRKWRLSCRSVSRQVVGRVRCFCASMNKSIAALKISGVNWGLKASSLRASSRALASDKVG